MCVVIILTFAATSGWLVYQSGVQKENEIPPSVKRKQMQDNLKIIADKYKSLEEVQSALRNAGLESSNLIVGIDYSKSNEYSGGRTFNGDCLHRLDDHEMNPYQQVIKIIGRTLEAFDEDKLIPLLGFGCSISRDKSSFVIADACKGFEEVLERYNQTTPNLRLGCPTSFAAVIRKAIEIVKQSRAYHILLIISDGEVMKVKETQDAIVEASHHPLSIIVVGVGDGPFDLMATFDDGLPKRRFDNFQFVNYDSVVSTGKQCQDIEFALRALMEIPEQYKALRSLRMV